MELFSRVTALIILLLLSPLFLVIIISCLIFNGRPIIFMQERVGHNHDIFKIYKFRTMRTNSGGLITKSDDMRITNFGRVLRMTKLDELPQLVNIIKGDMRFIGPRPEVEKYFDKSNFSFLNKVKPGLSDYSSILFRDEAKIMKKIGGDNPYSVLLPIKIELANYYTRKKNFILDFKLVIITIMAILFPVLTIRILVMPDVFKDIPNVKHFWHKYSL